MFKHFDFVVEGDCQTLAQVFCGDALLVAVRAAIDAALAPAGQVQHGLAQRLGRNSAGVHANAADAPALLDHKHGLLQLRGLHGSAPSSRS